MVGVERLCLLFYDEPAFVEEMMDAPPCEGGPGGFLALMDQILDHTTVPPL